MTFLWDHLAATATASHARDTVKMYVRTNKCVIQICNLVSQCNPINGTEGNVFTMLSTLITEQKIVVRNLITEQKIVVLVQMAQKTGTDY